MTRLTWIAIGLLILVSAILRQRLLFLISLILLMLAAASYLWAKYCLTNVSYSRRIGQRRLFHGNTAQMEVEIVNAKPLPLAWLRIDDEFPLALHPDYEGSFDDRTTAATARRRLVNVLSMRWYERVVRRYQLKGARRGIWHFGPAQLRSGDIFGFDIRRQTLEAIDTLLVYPKTVPVHALGLPPGHPFGEFASSRRVIEDPLRLMGTRTYVPGDAYRHIHWKATARRYSGGGQALQTKVFEPSATRPVAIFLNLSTSLSTNIGQDLQILEFAITAAASIARHIWEQGEPVGLYANGLVLSYNIADESGKRGTVGRARIAPRSHPEQLLRIFEALARIEGRGRWSLANLLHAESGSLVFGTTVVVISAVANDPLRGAMSEMVRKGFRVVWIGLAEGKLGKPIMGVTDYYIGGLEEWEKLEVLENVPDSADLHISN